MSYPKGDIGAALRARLKPGDWVIDVGASNGCVSTECAKVVGPTGRVFAFEPDPRWWGELGRAVQDYHPTISAFALVVTHGNGPTTYYQSRHQYQSAAEPANPGLESPTPMQSHAIRLDDWFAETPIAAVKLDVQGNEANVLKGATKLLQTCPCWVWECWPAGLHAQGATAQGLCETFTHAGYRVLRMDGEPIGDPGALDTWTGMSHCNLLAVK